MVVRIILLCIVFLLVVLFFTFIPMGLWISAVAANVKVGIFNLVGMKLRRVAPKKIVFPLIKATKAGIPVTVNQLEAHYLAGGNVAEIPKAMAQALREGHIGVLDYYKLQNVLADTEMKKNIGTGANAYAESKREA